MKRLIVIAILAAALLPLALARDGDPSRAQTGRAPYFVYDAVTLYLPVGSNGSSTAVNIGTLATVQGTFPGGTHLCSETSERRTADANTFHAGIAAGTATSVLSVSTTCVVSYTGTAAQAAVSSTVQGWNLTVGVYDGRSPTGGALSQGQIGNADDLISVLVVLTNAAQDADALNDFAADSGGAFGSVVHTLRLTSGASGTGNRYTGYVNISGAFVISAGQTAFGSVRSNSNTITVGGVSHEIRGLYYDSTADTLTFIHQQGARSPSEWNGLMLRSGTHNFQFRDASNRRDGVRIFTWSGVTSAPFGASGNFDVQIRNAPSWTTSWPTLTSSNIASTVHHGLTTTSGSVVHTWRLTSGDDGSYHGFSSTSGQAYGTLANNNLMLNGRSYVVRWLFREASSSTGAGSCTEGYFQFVGAPSQFATDFAGMSLRQGTLTETISPMQTASYSYLWGPSTSPATIDCAFIPASGTVDIDLVAAGGVATTGLALPGNGLTGAAGTAMDSLKRLGGTLTSLDLSGNTLSGGIPRIVGDLTGLTSLDLSGNTLSGAVPRDLARLTSLTTLDLSGNAGLTMTPAVMGAIAGALTSVTSLDLSGTAICADPTSTAHAAFISWIQGIRDANSNTGVAKVRTCGTPTAPTFGDAGGDVTVDLPAGVSRVGNPFELGRWPAPIPATAYVGAETPICTLVTVKENPSADPADFLTTGTDASGFVALWDSTNSECVLSHQDVTPTFASASRRAISIVVGVHDSVDPDAGTKSTAPDDSVRVTVRLASLSGDTALLNDFYTAAGGSGWTTATNWTTATTRHTFQLTAGSGSGFNGWQDAGIGADDNASSPGFTGGIGSVRGGRTFTLGGVGRRLDHLTQQNTGATRPVTFTENQTLRPASDWSGLFLRIGTTDLAFDAGTTAQVTAGRRWIWSDPAGGTTMIIPASGNFDALVVEKAPSTTTSATSTRHGVTVASTTVQGATLSRVTRLALPDNNLTGDAATALASLGGLSALTSLDLSGNALTGDLPAGLGALSGLQTLDLSGNTGLMPTVATLTALAGKLTALTNIDLRDTGFCIDAASAAHAPLRAWVHGVRARDAGAGVFHADSCGMATPVAPAFAASAFTASIDADTGSTLVHTFQLTAGTNANFNGNQGAPITVANALTDPAFAGALGSVRASSASFDVGPGPSRSLEHLTQRTTGGTRPVTFVDNQESRPASDYDGLMLRVIPQPALVHTFALTAGSNADFNGYQYTGVGSGDGASVPGFTGALGSARSGGTLSLGGQTYRVEHLSQKKSDNTITFSENQVLRGTSHWAGLALRIGTTILPFADATTTQETVRRWTWSGAPAGIIPSSGNFDVRLVRLPTGVSTINLAFADATSSVVAGVGRRWAWADAPASIPSSGNYDAELHRPAAAGLPRITPGVPFVGAEDRCFIVSANQNGSNDPDDWSDAGADVSAQFIAVVDGAACAVRYVGDGSHLVIDEGAVEAISIKVGVSDGVNPVMGTADATADSEVEMTLVLRGLTTDRDALWAAYDAAGGSGWTTQTGWEGTLTFGAVQHTYQLTAGSQGSTYGLFGSRGSVRGGRTFTLSGVTYTLQGLYLVTTSGTLYFLEDQTGQAASRWHGHALRIGTTVLPFIDATTSTTSDWRIWSWSNVASSLIPSSGNYDVQVGAYAPTGARSTPSSSNPYHGVTLGGTPSRVTGLALPDNNVAGTASAALGPIAGLNKLASLDLSGNALTGAIPAELMQLTALTSLDLSGNALTGAIPDLSALTALTSLDLSGNALTGIPATLEQMTGLTTLHLGGNAGLGLTVTALEGLATALTALTSVDIAGTGFCIERTGAAHADLRAWVTRVRGAGGGTGVFKADTCGASSAPAFAGEAATYGVTSNTAAPVAHTFALTAGSNAGVNGYFGAYGSVRNSSGVFTLDGVAHTLQQLRYTASAGTLVLRENQPSEAASRWHGLSLRIGGAAFAFADAVSTTDSDSRIWTWSGAPAGLIGSSGNFEAVVVRPLAIGAPRFAAGVPWLDAADACVIVAARQNVSNDPADFDVDAMTGGTDVSGVFAATRDGATCAVSYLGDGSHITVDSGSVEAISIRVGVHDGVDPDEGTYSTEADDAIDVTLVLRGITTDVDALGAFYTAADGSAWTTSTGWSASISDPIIHTFELTGGTSSSNNRGYDSSYGAIRNSSGVFTRNGRTYTLDWLYQSDGVQSTSLSFTPQRSEATSDFSGLSLRIGTRTVAFGSATTIFAGKSVFNFSSGFPAGHVPGSGDFDALILTHIHGLTVMKGRVTGIELPSNGLAGAAATALADLAELDGLEVLDLSGNTGLTGGIPAAITDLVNLTSLDLSGVGFTGVIPTDIADLAALTSLDLSDNALSGAIPATLASLTALETLDLGGNAGLGAGDALLDTLAGALTSLTSLDLSGTGVCVSATSTAHAGARAWIRNIRASGGGTGVAKVRTCETGAIAPGFPAGAATYGITSGTAVPAQHTYQLTAATFGALRGFRHNSIEVPTRGAIRGGGTWTRTGAGFPGGVAFDVREAHLHENGTFTFSYGQATFSTAGWLPLYLRIGNTLLAFSDASNSNWEGVVRRYVWTGVPAGIIPASGDFDVVIQQAPVSPGAARFTPGVPFVGAADACAIVAARANASNDPADFDVEDMMAADYSSVFDAVLVGSTCVVRYFGDGSHVTADETVREAISIRVGIHDGVDPEAGTFSTEADAVFDVTLVLRGLLTDRDALWAVYDAAGGSGWSNQGGWGGSTLHTFQLTSSTGQGARGYIHSTSAAAAILSRMNGQVRGSVRSNSGAVTVGGEVHNLRALYQQSWGNMLPLVFVDDKPALTAAKWANVSLRFGATVLDFADATSDVVTGVGRRWTWSDPGSSTLIPTSGNYDVDVIGPRAVPSATNAYDGVTLGGTPARVTALALSDYGLTGAAGAVLARLTELDALTSVDLSDNDGLTGALPLSLFTGMGSLATLDLSDIGFSGGIPAAVGNLPASLTTLDLGGNGLSGTIPAGIGALTGLTVLSLANNALTDDLPGELGDLTALTTLNLAGNAGLSAPVTVLDDLAGKLTALTRLDLSGTGICVSATAANQADIRAWIATIRGTGMGTGVARVRTCGAPSAPAFAAEAASVDVVSEADGSSTAIDLGEYAFSWSVAGGYVGADPVCAVRARANGSNDPAAWRVTSGTDLSADFTVTTSTVVMGTTVTYSCDVEYVGDGTNIVAADTTLEAVSVRVGVHDGINPAAGTISTGVDDAVRLTMRLAGQPTDRDALDALYDGTGGDAWTTGTGWSYSTEHTFQLTAATRGDLTGYHHNTIGLSGVLGAVRGGGAITLNSVAHSVYMLVYDAANDRVEFRDNQPAQPTSRWNGLSLRIGALTLAFAEATVSGTSSHNVWRWGNIATSPIADGDFDVVVLRATGAVASTWHGVTVDATSTRVTAVELSDNNLAGDIPAAFGTLAGLESQAAMTTLDLSDNALTGRIPASLGDLTTLTSLDLSGNMLTGAIPRELEALTALTTLDLADNAGLTIGGATLNALAEDLTALTSLDLSGTTVCADPDDPDQPAVDGWIETIRGQNSGAGVARIDTCGSPAAAAFPAAAETLALTSEADGSTTAIAIGGPVLTQGTFVGARDAVCSITAARANRSNDPDDWSVSDTSRTDYASDFSIDPATCAISYGGTGIMAVVDMLEAVSIRVAIHDGINPAMGVFATTEDDHIEVTVELRGITTDADALDAFYAATGGASWTTDTNWSSAMLGMRLGVSVTGTPERVTGLALPGNNLRGAIPASFENLDGLTALDLSGNTGLAGSGAVPVERLDGLRALTSLDLDGIGYSSMGTGLAPRLQALTTLDLGDNAFASLPSDFNSLTALTTLNLANNRLGALPADFGDLTALTDLDLSGNRLTSLPSDFNQLTALTDLDLSGNRLGALPADFNDLTALATLDLSGNAGLAIPVTTLEALGSALTSLTSVDLSGTGVCVEAAGMAHQTVRTWVALVRASGSGTGTFRVATCGAPAAPAFAAAAATYGITSGTDGSGAVPAAVGASRFTAAAFVGAANVCAIVSANQNDDNDPARWSDAGADVSSVFAAALSGSTCAVTYSGDGSHIMANEGSLEAISIRVGVHDGVNPATGRLSASPDDTIDVTLVLRGIVTDGDALDAIYTATGGSGWTTDTGWSGATVSARHGVTVSSAGLPTNRVTALALPSNGLRGAAATALARLTELDALTALDLSGNAGLTGGIPAVVAELANLQTLDLGGVGFTGTIPADLATLTSLTSLDLSGNALGGDVPGELGGLTTLTTLDLSDNAALGGDLNDLITLTALMTLDLTGTRLCVNPATDTDVEAWLNNLRMAGASVGVHTCGSPNAPTLANAALAAGLDAGASGAGPGNAIAVAAPAFRGTTYSGGEDVCTIATAVANPSADPASFATTGTDLKAQFAIDAATCAVSYTGGGLTRIANTREAVSIAISVTDGVNATGGVDASEDDSLRLTVKLLDLETDRLALNALYAETNGDGWNARTNWGSSSLSGSWYGVTLTLSRVTRLELPNNNLSGRLPALMGDLSKLQRLNLRENGGLTGGVPREFAALNVLATFDVQSTRVCARNIGIPAVNAWLANIRAQGGAVRLGSCPSPAPSVSSAGITVVEEGDAAPTGTRYSLELTCGASTVSLSLAAGERYAASAPPNATCSLTVTDRGDATAVRGEFADQTLGAGDVTVTFVLGVADDEDAAPAPGEPNPALERALVEGVAYARWPSPDMPVADAVEHLTLCVIAVYWWDAPNQAWRSWFPGGAALGVNTLDTLVRGGIYVFSTEERTPANCGLRAADAEAATGAAVG